jgi:S1-C subfamily serine protease
VPKRFVLLTSVSVLFVANVGCFSAATAQVRVPPPINPSADGLITRTRQAVVSITATNPGLAGAVTGTGFIVSADGDIVTCNHVVNNGGA